MTEVETSQQEHKNDVPTSLDYSELSLYGAVRESAEENLDKDAYEFMGRKVKYERFIKNVDDFAVCLYNLGVRKGDKVLICLPNCPQALFAFYGTSKCGGVVTMVHPLSAKNEIGFYLRNSKCKVVVTMDAFCNNFTETMDGTGLEKIIVTSMKDELNSIKGIGYSLTLGRKTPKIIENDKIIMWKDILKQNRGKTMPDVTVDCHDPAAILYSGGTTGKSKGILLSSFNINATALQTIVGSGCSMKNGRTVLSIMPMFHGFGLCVGIHMFLIFGGKCVLVPRFKAETYAKLVVKKKPNYIAGVPTLFEMMIRSDCFRNADLSCLKGIFVGGDSLTIELRTKMEKFLKEHNCDTMLREGYGLTECVTVSCLTPIDEYRPGSIGLPLPDTLYSIVKFGTTESLPYGEEGEICISGPSVMMGYVDEEEETKETLKTHGDGRVWLHTGDVGVIDQDGFVYFKQRYKRMIISSGYNIYPSQIENILDQHPMILNSCVIGVHDDIKQQVTKAYIVLKKGVQKSDELMKEIKNYCRENIAKYAIPREFEVIDEMPRTKIGKISYRDLEDKDKASRAK